MAAMSAPVAGSARTGRAVRYGCGAALAIFAAVVTGGVLLIMLWLNAGSSIRPTLPAVRVPIAGSVVLMSDGMTVVYSDPNALCGTASLSAAETRTGVMLSLYESADAGQATCPGLRFGSTQPTPVPPFDPAGAILPADPVLATTPVPPATVTLDTPLAGRRLVDASTGRVIPYFDQRSALRLTAPDWLAAFPIGDISSAVPYFGGPGAVVFADNLIGTNTPMHQLNGWSLTIVQVAGGGWHPPPGTVIRRVIIRGHHGLAAAGIIVWTEAGRTIAVIGQVPAPRLAERLGRAPMPFAKLLAIADALRKGGTA